jgi:hypothetical protein
VWLCGPLLAVLHGLERQHAYCAEHGAFEERTAEGDAAAQAVSSTALPSTPADGEDHDGCAFSPFAAGTAAPRAPGVAVTAAPPAPPLVAPDLAVVPAPPLAVLDVAPKSSPPSAA